MRRRLVAVVVALLLLAGVVWGSLSSVSGADLGQDSVIWGTRMNSSVIWGTLARTSVIWGT